jgi:YebC/PmpR family DNA-binding regulatory protein
MSGHSKWATIKHKKAALDAKRGKVFTRIIKEIMIAARGGGGDPDANPRLRTAVLAAKAVSMPNDNITRAIKRGTGEIEGGSIEEYTYEGYGPGGVAIVVEVATDNKNRAVSEIRHAFSKNGGNMGEQGSVAWMFERKGQILLEGEDLKEDDLMNLVLEAGADDLRQDGDTWEVLTATDALNTVQEALQKANIKIAEAKIAMIPKNLVPVEASHTKGLLKLLDALEEHEDVQNVFSNADIDEEAMEALA